MTTRSLSKKLKIYDRLIFNELNRIRNTVRTRMGREYEYRHSPSLNDLKEARWELFCEYIENNGMLKEVSDEKNNGIRK